MKCHNECLEEKSRNKLFIFYFSHRTLVILHKSNTVYSDFSPIKAALYPPPPAPRGEMSLSRQELSCVTPHVRVSLPPPPVTLAPSEVKHTCCSEILHHNYHNAEASGLVTVVKHLNIWFCVTSEGGHGNCVMIRPQSCMFQMWCSSLH